MSTKHFYRTTEAERKRKCRRRTTTIKLDSKLSELQTNCCRSDVVEETSIEIPMVVEDFCTYSENIDYQCGNEEPFNRQHTLIGSSSANESEESDDVDDNNIEVFMKLFIFIIMRKFSIF
jgi:hypothetical protein